MASSQIQLSASSELSVYAAGSPQTAYAMASLIAPQYENVRRPSLDIVAVIDKSGSMAGEKLALVKKTLNTLVAQLKDADRLALVSFDTDVRTEFDLRSMSTDGKASALHSIGALVDGSSTNLSGGLLEGIRILRDRNPSDKREVSSVLLLTDGQANHGITTSDAIVAATRAMLDSAPQPTASLRSSISKSIGNVFSSIRSRKPVEITEQSVAEAEVTAAANSTPSSISNNTTTIYTFGYGSDADAKMLKAISDAGNGAYYFIENFDAVSTSFGDCLGGLVSICAQNLNLELRVGKDATIKKVHSKNAVELKDNNTCAVVKLADLQSEEHRDIVVEVALSSVQPSDKQLILSASLSYLNVITMQVDTIYATLTVGRPATLPANVTKNVDVDKQKNRIVASDALEQAALIAKDRSNASLERARGVVQAALSVIRASLSASDAYCLELVRDLERCLEGLQDRATFDHFGESEMYSRAQSHGMQRSNKAAPSAYTGSAKRAMKGLF